MDSYNAIVEIKRGIRSWWLCKRSLASNSDCSRKIEGIQPGTLDSNGLSKNGFRVLCK